MSLIVDGLVYDNHPKRRMHLVGVAPTGLRDYALIYRPSERLWTAWHAKTRLGGYKTLAQAAHAITAHFNHSWV